MENKKYLLENLSETESLEENLNLFEFPNLPIKEYPHNEEGYLLIPSIKEWDEE